MPFEAQQFVTSGKGTCQAQRQHRAFGAGADEADFLCRGHQFSDQRRPLQHLRVVVAKMQTVADHTVHSVQHVGVRVTEQERAVAHAVVDVLVAVDVPLSRAARMVDIDRRDRAVAQIVPNAAGHQLPHFGI